MAASSSVDARIGRSLDDAIEGERIWGCVALVGRGGEASVTTGGVRDLETGEPMERDTLFAVASIGKPITAASVLCLVEDGVFALDDPIDPWLPELSDPPRSFGRWMQNSMIPSRPTARSLFVIS